MMLSTDTRIAGQKTVADWIELKRRLSSCNDATIWHQAFEDYYKLRLDSRYFKPIKALEEMKKCDGEGFAIVTLHCSLIEFLASTLEGKNYRYVRKGEPKLGQFEYSNVGELFQNFLTSQSPFDQMFTDEAAAEDFYACVRCGLLHEARTKGAWRILVDSSANKAIDTDKKIIYRNKMQTAFHDFVKWYGEALPADKKLQEAFIRKFDSLCEY